MSKNDINIDRLIVRYLDEHPDISRTQLAAKMGYSDQYIYAVIKKKRGVTPDFLKKFQAISGYSFDTMIGVPQLPSPPLHKVPLFAGAIPAGFPKEVPASYVEEYVDCPEKHCDFAVRVKGDSMIGKGINDRDTVFCVRQTSADNGQIVVARVDRTEEYTIKTFKRLDSQIMLLPANEKYEPIILKKVDIVGVVIGVFHKI